MSFDNLIARLNKVKRTGEGRYIACCPGHDDKSPSMAIRELTDGRVLLHCFSGCDTETILGAIGLTFSDLFPELLMQHGKPERRPFNAHDVLACIQSASRQVAIAAIHVANGTVLTEADKARLLVDAGRLNEACEMCNG